MSANQNIQSPSPNRQTSTKRTETSTNKKCQKKKKERDEHSQDVHIQDSPNPSMRRTEETRTGVEQLTSLLAARIPPESKDIAAALAEMDSKSLTARAIRLPESNFRAAAARVLVSGFLPPDAPEELRFCVACALVGERAEALVDSSATATTRHSSISRPFREVFCAAHTGQHPTMTAALRNLPAAVDADSPLGRMWAAAQKEVPLCLLQSLSLPPPSSDTTVGLYARRMALVEILAPLLAIALDAARPLGTSKKTPVPVAKEVMRGNEDELLEYQ